jgi:SET domain-containing protein
MKLTKMKSKINGGGMFAKENIQKGKIFYKVPTRYIFKHYKEKCVYLTKGLWVHDDNVLNWVNHSCDPNVKLIFKNGNLLLKALKKIKQNEEITCDYELTEFSFKKIKCNCKSKKCRGHFIVRC